MRFSFLALATVVQAAKLDDSIKSTMYDVHRNMQVAGRNLEGHCEAMGKPDPAFLSELELLFGNTPIGQELLSQVSLSYEHTIGMTTSLICEAGDASETGMEAMDGMSGSTDFPHGPIKPIATVGELSVCPESEGERVVGVPDGMGAYLIDDDTVRVVVQSESYGPLRYEAYPFPVNNEMATFTGSHIQYVDYGREALSTFMDSDVPASDFVKGFGEVITASYNLKGEPVGPRNLDGPTVTGAHYSNTDVEGNYAVVAVPSAADWLMQSLCSAHLEQPHQWGDGIGVEDNLFITNEEWMTYAEGTDFVGIAAHAVDLATGEDFALGVFTQGGFEKIVEINPQNPNIVVFSLAGYNGAFDNFEKELQDRKDEYPHPEGGEWVWTRDVVPGRIYIGVKGVDEQGQPCDDFLCRNGLRFGQIYGFAVTKETEDRDPWHKTVMNGAKVEGKWLPIDWRWDGEVKDYSHDGAWHFQIDPPGFPEMKFWNANGNTGSGAKMEHNTPDPRPGNTAFIQGSTAGYFGHYYVTSDLSAWMPGDDFPAELDGEYYVYQGEQDIRKQIELGGMGQYRDGYDATVNYSKNNAATDVTRPTNTFEDIDGLEAIWDGTDLRVIIQEDSGSYYGERMLISSPLEHEDDGMELTYYFVAQSGGKFNTRMTEGVGVPPGVSQGVSAHEFSGVFDMSGLLAKSEGSFILSASGDGEDKRNADATVGINDKLILLGLQSGNMRGGMIDTFQCDRGGQWLVYEPDVPDA